MKRWLATLLVFVFCSAIVRADVTLVQTTTIEGGMAQMAGAGGANMSPKSTVFIKGMKSRTEMDAGPVSVITITDLATKQVIILRPDQKTATIVTATPPPAAGTGAPATPLVTLAIDASIKPTGKTQVIDGFKCDEFTFTTTMDMGKFGGIPPEAAAMLQGVKMIMAGSIWVTKDVPGGAEYIAFQKAAAAGDMASAVAGAAGVSMPGMDEMMKAMGSLDGLAYLSEMTMKVEGSGQVADMMKQMGAMKVTSRTTSIKADSLSDNLFKVPEGYTTTK